MVMAGDEEGGLEKHVIELTNGLKQRGHKLTVIAHEKYLNRVDTDFIAVDLTKSRRNVFVLYQMYKVLKQLQPDIVHVHGNKAAAIVGRLLSFINIPSVATLHSRKKNTKMFRPYDAVIAVSPNAAETLNHKNTHVILNGIIPPKLQSSLIKPKKKIVLAVGRLVPVKGFDVLLNAWKNVQDAELWIVGDGFEEHKLRDLIGLLNLNDSVQMLGYRSDVVELMQQATIYVMSSHYEGCPYTMIEALLCEVPMVSTSVGAMTMVLPKKYLIPPNDAESLGHCLNECLKNLEQMQSDYQRVFAYAKQNLVLDGMIDKIEKTYRSVKS
ncbi:glycosyltransferase family 4 protein [Acinetobacter sp. ANC 5414]|uniref:glycosyltransferase family 4 protein n=1 Tax=Acinetobacter sp. ANC 5414 TaxID=2731251 RepID=UPI0014907829|nr:glycosyltransferase family 4 protein [Acinetobacter sp. ANC 5414]NNH00127.1 glycosyltransferase family 4 protein [Acinetobacter sp. ANC 5414]